MSDVRMVECPRCGGVGSLSLPGGAETCLRCAGVGKVENTDCIDCEGAGVKPGLLDGFLAAIECKTCEGTGYRK